MTSTDRHYQNLDPRATHPNPRLFERSRTVCMGLVLLGAIGVIIGWPMNPQQFYFSYLSSWSFAWTTVMGVLFFVMMHYLVDAGWSTVVRRPAEHLLAAMPLLLLLAIPVIIGTYSGQLQHWIHADPARDELLHKKTWFLNVPFLTGRLCFYAIVFLALAFIMRRNSIRQDRDGDAKWTISSRRWSAGGIILYALALSFCAFDLLMALDHHWFSTVFGVYTWTGGVVSGLCVLTLVCLSLRRGPLKEYIGSDQVHDLGKLIFAFSVFWAYIAFSQYFLIWYGNIPEETTYYLRRWTGVADQGTSWWIVSITLGVVRFLLPLLVLMSANVKRNEKALATMCVVLLFGHWVDQYWMVQPEHSPSGPPLRYLWLDLSALMLVAGLCGWSAIRAMRKTSLIPWMDPRLVEALSAEHVEEIEHAEEE